MSRQHDSHCIIIAHPSMIHQSEPAAAMRQGELNYKISCALQSLRRTRADIQHLLFWNKRRGVSAPLLEPRAFEPVYETIDRLLRGLQKYYQPNKKITFIVLGVMHHTQLTKLSNATMMLGHGVRTHPAMFCLDVA